MLPLLRLWLCPGTRAAQKWNFECYHYSLDSPFASQDSNNQVMVVGKISSCSGSTGYCVLSYRAIWYVVFSQTHGFFSHKSIKLTFLLPQASKYGLLWGLPHSIQSRGTGHVETFALLSAYFLYQWWITSVSVYKKYRERLG